MSRKYLAVTASVGVLVIGGIVFIDTAGIGESSSSDTSSRSGRDLSRETEAEIEKEAQDPFISRDLEEMIVASPRDQQATAEQIERQILTNMESNDPTHPQKASCNFMSEYSNYMHFFCSGVFDGGRGGVAHIEVTVDTLTGSVSTDSDPF